MMRVITHIMVHLWGFLLANRMTGENYTSLYIYCLSTFTWTFPAILAAHYFAFAFLATIFGSKECVMTGTEGLINSEFVTNMTGAHCCRV